MKAQDYKDIKISNVDTVKIMANNEVWWEQNSLFKPDYEFYDSEIGKNSNWSKHKSGYWYLNKFEGQYIVYVRHCILQGKNHLGKFIAGLNIKIPVTDIINDYSFLSYSKDPYDIRKSEDYLLENYNDNNYKTYVFKCPSDYNEDFEQKLKDFANSL